MPQNCHSSVRGWRQRGLGLLAAIHLGAVSVSAATTPAFADGVSAGLVTTYDLWEASGVVASRQNRGVVYAHNDSGYRGTVFALSTNGTLLGRLPVPNVYSGDFEDIAIGPGPQPGRDYVYLGDIGDNYLGRASIRVFRFPEPAVYPYQSNAPVTHQISGAQEIELRYPDGPFNAEALLLDPRTGDLFIATKLTNSSRIYRATRTELNSGGPIELTFMREISFKSVSAGDVSPDGSMVALRRNNKASLWVRQPGQSISDALAGNAINIPVIGQPDEPNGEALGFTADNAGYYTLSEGSQPPLCFFRRTDAGIPTPARVLIGPGETWRYRAYGLNEGVAWRDLDYDDAWWMSGPAQLGYGQADEATVIYDGGDPADKIPTTYFRKQFSLGAGVTITNLVLRICFNDGAAVYLNGTEILRRNLATSAAFADLAGSSNSALQNMWLTVPVSPALLRTGVNVVAVELHRFALDGPDLSFDLQLLEGTVEASPRFSGPPQIVAGECRIGLSGSVGVLATVEMADNLQRWNPAGQIVLTNGVGTFREPVTNSATRLFRIGH